MLTHERLISAAERLPAAPPSLDVIFFHSETKSKNTCGGNNVCRLEGRGCTAATAPPLPSTDLQVSTIHWERLAASSWDEATLEVRAGHTHTHTVSTAVQPDV